MRGTHKDTLLGAAPTGNRIDFEGMTFLRFNADGRIAERFQKGTGRRAGQRDFRKRRTSSWLP